MGGAAPPRDGEVAGVGAGACYGGSGVAGIRQKGGERLGELGGGVVATNPRSERGNGGGKGLGRAEGTPVRDSGSGERA
jgi:hypothetical protein